MEENSIIERNIVFIGKNFKVVEVKSSHKGKVVIEEVFDGGNSVGALVYNTETKKYLFVEKYRHAGAEGVLVEIVAGTMEEGETPQDTIKREVIEELGYKVDKLVHINDFYVSPGANTEICALFYAEVSEKLSEGGGVDDENIKVVEVEDLGLNGNLFFEFPEEGDVIPPYKLIDGKSIMAVNWHVQNKMMKSLWETVSDFKMKSL